MKAAGIDLDDEVFNLPHGTNRLSSIMPNEAEMSNQKSKELLRDFSVVRPLRKTSSVRENR